MTAYEPVLRRIFESIVPGHRLLVVPEPQPATAHTPAGFRVTFPVNDELAERHFGRLWSDLDVPLRFQMIAYLAGHEAMHGWEMAHGYQATPANTLRGLLANILADIRGDYLSVLDRLTNWSTNREIAYRILCEPVGTPADAEPEQLPHADALRLVYWALQYMRCGRLRLTDHTAVAAPTHPIYQQIWPRITQIVIQARQCSWEKEPELVDQLLKLLWAWTRDEYQRHSLAAAEDRPDKATTNVVDTDLTDPGKTGKSDCTDPFYWQDPEPHNDEDNDIVQEASGDDTSTGNETGPPSSTEVDAYLEEAIAQLRAALADSNGETGCHTTAEGNTRADGESPNQQSLDALDEIRSSGLHERAEGDLIEEIERQDARHRSSADADRQSDPAAVLHGDALASLEFLPAQWQKDVRPRYLTTVQELSNQITLLSTHLSTVLRPLLEGPSYRKRATARGNRLDLDRQASRIFVQAEHGAEQEPPIWLDQHAHGHGKIQLNAVIVVDCSESMMSGTPTLAAACHAAAAGLLGAADDLRDLVDVALAGFNDCVLAIRGFGDPTSMGHAVYHLAQAQSTVGGTALEPAIAWGLAQLHQVGNRRSRRRLLMMLTDAELDEWDALTSCKRIGESEEDIATVAIGLGDVNAEVLRAVVPNTVILRPDGIQFLPNLVQHLVENVVRNDRLVL